MPRPTARSHVALEQRCSVIAIRLREISDLASFDRIDAAIHAELSGDPEVTEAAEDEREDKAIAAAIDARLAAEEVEIARLENGHLSAEKAFGCADATARGLRAKLENLHARGPLATVPEVEVSLGNAYDEKSIKREARDQKLPKL